MDVGVDEDNAFAAVQFCHQLFEVLVAQKAVARACEQDDTIRVQGIQCILCVLDRGVDDRHG